LLRPFRAGALALAAASTFLLTSPALGHAASDVRVTPSGELRFDDYLGDADKLQIRFESAAQSGVADRFVVENEAGAVTSSAGCTALSPQAVACDAAPVGSIVSLLAAGNDALVISQEPGSAVSSRFSIRIRAGDGNDVIHTGDGTDRLIGEAGGDILAGGPGDDKLSGGAGGDGLIGFGGDDVLTGGEGRDALFGQKGKDEFVGGPGNDVLLARDHRRDAKINCGSGSQERAVRDRIDPPANRCDPKRGRKRG
jgi:Ca2+-binding RTX toxin-like protein